MNGSCKLGEAAGKMRRLEEDDTSTATDRLSHLPDPILHQILSFLETKSAVQTSVLSRAWRCAWRFVPALDIVSLFFQEYGSFLSFVDMVLSLRYPLNLHKIDVSAPYLKFFTLDDAEIPLEFVELSLPSLDCADIRMNRSSDFELIALFFGVRKAKSLTLDSETIQVVSKLNNLEHLPSLFTRLKYLNVQSSSIPYKVATFFLKGSPDTEPNIEFLPNGTEEDP